MTWNFPVTDVACNRPHIRRAAGSARNLMFWHVVIVNLIQLQKAYCRAENKEPLRIFFSDIRLERKVKTKVEYLMANICTFNEVFKILFVLM